MNRLESMSVFVAVVEAGSLSAAARQLGMPLATVSRKVAELEAHLKSRLLHRTTRQLSLTDHSCITFEVLSSVGAWVFGAGKAQQSVPVHSRLSVNTAEAAITAATLDVGVIRVLSYQVADAVQKGDLQVVLQPYESAALPISLVHKGQAPLPLKVRAFLDFVTPRLRVRDANIP